MVISENVPVKNPFAARAGKRRLVQKPSGVKVHWRERFVHVCAVKVYLFRLPFEVTSGR